MTEIGDLDDEFTIRRDALLVQQERQGHTRCNALALSYLYNSSWTGGELVPVSFSFSTSDSVAVSVSVVVSAVVDEEVEDLTALGALGAFLLINLNT